MYLPTAHPLRRGATLTEAGLTLTTAILLIVGLVVGALGVFRYQQVALAAREGARYCITHGGLYERELARPPITKAEVVARAINPVTPMLNLTPANVEIQVQRVVGSGPAAGTRESVDWEATDSPRF